MADTQKILTAALLGTAIGLAVGILMAPDKGSETRQRIADGGRKIADNLKEYANSGASAVTGLKDKLIRKKDSFSDKLVENSMG